VNMDPICRHYVDTVVEQDRERLLAAMSEVLDATLEYAKAIDSRLRSAPERLPGTHGVTPRTFLGEERMP
jgi:hypothetical protein